MSYRPSFSFSHSWDFLWKKDNKFNWITFTPFELTFEAGGYKGNYLEMIFSFMNFHFVLEVYDVESRKEFASEMGKLIDTWAENESITPMESSNID